jgi:hypothetical protein
VAVGITLKRTVPRQTVTHGKIMSSTFLGGTFKKKGGLIVAITKEEMNPSPIVNATVLKGFVDGVHKVYEITANDGYVLHDKLLDEEVIDPVTLEPTGEIKLGYYAGERSVAASYDFAANPREFYTVLENSVPADQIFNVEPDHETM